MNTITKRVTVGRDHHIRIEIDLPADFPEGDAEAIVDLKPMATTKNRLSEICGKGKGQFWMSDDFDEPLDDFADYR
jgi:hypothetical protein